MDFLPKPVKADELLDAIQKALTKDIDNQQKYEKLSMIRNRFKTLTPREKQVFELVVQGLLNKQVGAQLGIKEKTIKVHRGKVMEKMQVGSFAELVKFSAEVNFGANPP